MKTLAYDTETTGLRRRENKIFSFSLCDEDGNSSVHRLDGSPVRQTLSRRKLEQLWNDTTVAKTIHNSKFDVGFTMKELGKTEAEMRKHTIHDTLLMSKVLRNDHHGHGLKPLAWELAGVPMDDERAISIYKNYQHAPEHLMDKYQHGDAQRGMLLHLFFKPRIDANPDFKEIYESEVSVIWPTIAMENRGVMLNIPKCEALMAKLRTDADAVARRAEELYGTRKLGSPEVVKEILYNRLGYAVKKKTKSGKASTRKDYLLELRETQPCEFLDLVMKYRSWTHGVSTLRGYMERADDEGIVHPNISTCEAITARESCSDPNLQNVEKVGVLKNPFPVPARTVFRPRPGYVNFHIDYSGQEARLLIHYSGDKILVDIANGGGPSEFHGDTHSFAATCFYGDRFRNAVRKSQEWKTFRDASKNGFFAVCYGAAAAKLAATLGLPLEEGLAAARRLRTLCPKLGAMMQDTIREIKQNRYITTAFGRHLYVPPQEAYMGVNYRIQGTAAEMLKRAQIRVHDYLQKATSNEVKLLLPIHDELIIEYPRKRLSEAKHVLRHVTHLMTDFPGRFRVPLTAEVSIATVDWAHKVDFDLN